MDTTIYRPPAKVLASPSDAGTAALTLNNSLAQLLQTASEQLQLNQLLPLKYDWRSMVYTDGSQRKTDIGPNGRQTVQLGSGIYVPAKTDTEEGQCIGIQSTAPTRHNTPYRAVLVVILGALQQGYSSIMTDSVNSVHAIRAVMYYPAQVRYHRHKLLLELIKTAIMTLEGEVQLIKVRGMQASPAMNLQTTLLQLWQLRGGQTWICLTLKVTTGRTKHGLCRRFGRRMKTAPLA